MPMPSSSGPRSFQSTRPHEARRAALSSSRRSWWFQSTRPHEARRWERDLAGKIQAFQSTRPHEARLLYLLETTGQMQVSIHAPA
ncbi:hypothetical protein OF001_U180113 [Pseudomonas sp. OF001]|nr:hypothetical protein OF001_U180113 [Pseudomonas sp. OF001]